MNTIKNAIGCLCTSLKRVYQIMINFGGFLLKILTNYPAKEGLILLLKPHYSRITAAIES